MKTTKTEKFTEKFIEFFLDESPICDDWVVGIDPEINLESHFPLEELDLEGNKILKVRLIRDIDDIDEIEKHFAHTERFKNWIKFYDRYGLRLEIFADKIILYPIDESVCLVYTEGLHSYTRHFYDPVAEIKRGL